MDEQFTPVFEDAEDMSDGRRYEQDKNLFVQFYTRAVYSPFESAQKGRPVHVEQDFVKIMVPGNKLSNVDTLVTPEYQKRFAAKWDAYKAGRHQGVEGTLLSSWAALSITMVADLNAMGIHTVEQLANISDTIASKFPGGSGLRDKAETYLEAATDASVTTRLAEEKEALEAQLADMQEQIRALQAQTVKKAA